jgi:membrane dipeptidase
MKRREFLGVIGAGTIVHVAGLSESLPAQERESPEEIYRRSYAIDAMCFSASPAPSIFVQYLSDEKIEALRTSGITAMAMNMTSNFAELRYADNLFQAIKDRIATWDAIVDKNPDIFHKVTNFAELEEAKRNGKVGFIFCFQMSSPFGWDLNKLKTFVDLGVRQIQLVDGNRNFIADSCWELTDAGLSRFGFEAIEAFNDLGVIVDVSHVGEQSALDAIKTSKKPSIYSHSGCYTLCPHVRNASDRNIKALVDRGGVFGVYNQSGWLTKDPTISIDHFLAHVDHVINIGGEDSVCVGTDQDVVDMTVMRPNEAENHNRSLRRRRKDFPQLDWTIRHMRVPELSHPKRLLHLAQAMHSRGYKTSTIEKVIGGNYARVFKEVVR